MLPDLLVQYGGDGADIGGEAVEGIVTNVPFLPGDPRPTVQRFVTGFTAMFGVAPDAYNGRAYDTFILLATVMRQFGAERVTSRNLKVVRVDADNNLLIVRCAVPGPNGGMLLVRETNKLG